MVERIVSSLADAKKGDIVWLFEAQRSSYVDGKYVGRGVWSALPISEETRLSFVVSGQKFDRVTGAVRTRNDYNPGDVIAGEIERGNILWKGRSWAIGEAVRKLDDVSLLKQIAVLIGMEAPAHDR